MSRMATLGPPELESSAVIVLVTRPHAVMRAQISPNCGRSTEISTSCPGKYFSTLLVINRSPPPETSYSAVLSDRDSPECPLMDTVTGRSMGWRANILFSDRSTGYFSYAGLVSALIFRTASMLLRKTSASSGSKCSPRSLPMIFVAFPTDIGSL